ncbi:unnamed protein product [Symbiodinium natans]|uniref:Uncharacterized protein n=1 Tax=Symbiodinium natans TaxID=878477 RepID=A0A812LA04_9DINO|nr:unnamed protein product [Symbiodinium natans]
MGDRFIQLGDWRLADIDGTHFSISHKDGWTAQVYKSDGTLHPQMWQLWGSWHRPIGPSKGIRFGFQFIEIGQFRLGAVDDNLFSISCLQPQQYQFARDRE